MAAKLDDKALDQLFRSARTYNGYLDRPVSTDLLEALWDLMKMAPTAANSMPARIIWCVSPESKERLAALAGGANPDKIRQAPVTAIIGMDTDFHEQLPWLLPHVDYKSYFAANLALRQESAFRNSSLQGAYLIMAARALGLDTGPMSGFDNAAVDQAFFSETPNIRSNFLVTLGYGDPASIFERSPRPEFGKFTRVA